MVLIVCLQLILVQPQSLPQTHNIYLDFENVSLEREFYFSYLARKERESWVAWGVGSLKKQKVAMRDLDDWIQVFELI